MTGEPNSVLVEFLRAAERILVFTGAGVSTGSGIEDYRGPTGIWKQRQPVYYQDFMASEDSRCEYWDWKLEDWEKYRDSIPNAVHYALADLERAGKLRMLVTQNIDGLHSKGGTSRDRLVEIHGTNLLVECQACHEMTDPHAHFESFTNSGKPPVCHCGGFLKPATISFGQNLRQEDLQRSADAARDADLVISLGSTLSVHPAAGIPLAAAQRGCPYVIINRGQTDHDGLREVSLRLEGDVAELFPPAVDSALQGRDGD